MSNTTICACKNMYKGLYIYTQTFTNINMHAQKTYACAYCHVLLKRNPHHPPPPPPPEINTEGSDIFTLMTKWQVYQSSLSREKWRFGTAINNVTISRITESCTAGLKLRLCQMPVLTLASSSWDALTFLQAHRGDVCVMVSVCGKLTLT